MKKLLFASIAALSLMVTSCSKNNDNTNQPKTESTLQGTISTDMTLTKDKIWNLKGYVYVAAGKTLTIEAGTVIKGDVTEKGILVIERNAKINAKGTATNPIVFTSGKPAGERASGDWGGVFILGNGITNQGTDVQGEGGINRTYGGNNNEDSSGVLSYVRIEYAGVAVSANNEVNALSLAGVGSKTQIDHIQIWYAKDDAVECWGGAVNLKYIAAFGTADDDLDFDFGYQGKMQYVYILKDPAVADPGDASNGIESDNENAATTPTPYTRPVLSNITLCGPNSATANDKHNYGGRWRRESKFALYNSIITGFLKGGFSIESAATATSYVDNSSSFKYNFVHSIANPYLSADNAPAIIDAAAMKVKAEGNGCVTMTTSTQVVNASAFSLTAPNAVPPAGSAALSGAVFTDADVNVAFFEKPAYRGAFGTTNWMEGWTSFTAQTNAYN